MLTYELTDESKEKVVNGVTYVAYRIRAKAGRPILGMRKGDPGGFVENEENLLHNSAGWVGDNAVVCGGARVLGARSFLATPWFSARLLYGATPALRAKPASVAVPLFAEMSLWAIMRLLVSR